MEKLINYLKRFGEIKELYQNHDKTLIELNTNKNIFWIFRYLSPKGKITYCLSKLKPTRKGGLEAEIKTLNYQYELRKNLENEIEKEIEPPKKKDIGYLSKPLSENYF